MEANEPRANETGSESPANGKVNTVVEDQFIEEVLDAGVPVLVDFWATWCGPCKTMGPRFAELAPEYEGKVRFAKMDVDQSPGIANALQIDSIPTFMLFSGRVVAGYGVGAVQTQELRQWIDEGLERIASLPDQMPPAEA
jgi:thioredoxin